MQSLAKAFIGLIFYAKFRLLFFFTFPTASRAISMARVIIIQRVPETSMEICKIMGFKLSSCFENPGKWAKSRKDGTQKVTPNQSNGKRDRTNKEAEGQRIWAVILPEYWLITRIDLGSTNSMRPIGTSFCITIVAVPRASSIDYFKNRNFCDVKTSKGKIKVPWRCKSPHEYALELHEA